MEIRTFNWRKQALLLSMALIMLSGSVFAQGLTAVRGVVRDASSAQIPGVEITVTDSASGVARTVLTNETGSYVVSQLPPGTYTVRAELAGFKTRVMNNVSLPVNETITMNIDLEVGALSDVVEVVAATDAVSTVDAKLGTGFDSKKIIDLPLNARNIVGLLGLQAGVTVNNQDGGQVNGARNDQQNIVLDGVNINRQDAGSAMQGALPTTLDSVQEFIVQTAGTDAAAGRGSGGQVQLVTRRGSNDWHGSAYWFYRTNGTSAANYFAPKNPDGTPQVTPLIRNIPGASLGGPVKKDKLFIFGAYERRTDRSASLVTRNVPTLEMLDGNLRYRRTDNTFGTITTGCGSMLEAWTGIPCDTWSSSLVGPNGLWEKYRPYSTIAAARLAAGDGSVRGGDNGANILRFAFNAPDRETTNVYISRLDYTLNSKHTFFFRGTLNDTVQTSNGGQETFPGLGNSRDRLDNSKGFSGNWNWVVSPTVNSNFTAGLTRESFETTGLAIDSYSPLYTNFLQTGGGAVQAINTWNLVEQLSWVKGKHNFQGGANVRMIRNNVNSFSAVGLPSYGTAANLTGNNIGVNSSPGLLRAIGATEFARAASAINVGDAVIAATGSVTRFSEDVQYDISGNRLASGIPFVRKMQMEEYEFYLQDTWRLRNSLTVNAGITYGVQTPPYEANGVQVNWVQDMGARWREAFNTTRNTLTMPLLTTQVAGRKNGKADYYETDTNNFGPRVSVAWTPQSDGMFGFLTKGGQFVVRGGYSLSYDGMGRSFAREAAQSGSIGLKTTFAIPGFAYSIDGLDGVPRAPRISGNASAIGLPRSVFPVAPAKSDFSLPVSTGSSVGGCTVACGAGAVSTIAIDPSLKSARNHLLNLTLSKELANGWVVEASYVGRFARDLIGSVDIASPINVRDAQSGMTYYDAIKQFYDLYESNKGARASVLPTVQPIAWFENVYKDKVETAARIRGLPIQANATRTFFSLLHRTLDPGPNTQASLVDTIQDIEQRAGSLLLQPQVQFFGMFANYSRSNYNSGQFTVRKRFSSGFSMTANYTLSKSLDITSAAESRGNRADGGTGEGLLHDPYNADAQYTVSDFDRRHQFNGNFLYELPFGRGKLVGRDASAVVNHLIGGWEISGIPVITSGRPFNYTAGSRFNHHYFGRSIPRLIKPIDLELIKAGGDVYLIGPDEATRRQIALDNFANVYPGSPIARNEGLSGPGFFNVDMKLGKTINFAESVTGKLSVESFNALNHPNFSIPSIADVDSGSGAQLGRITTIQGSMRVYQFGFRLQF